MIDVVAALFVVSLALVALAAYGLSIVTSGRRAFPRVAKEGSSALLNRYPMEATHWALEPMGRACARAGVSANHVTAVSLLLAACAGVALGMGHWGLGGALAAVSALGDTLDGIVARKAGTASDAGETFDAVVDRYSEVFFLGGVACALRASVALLVLTLAALLASFMVSYTTAKAEALGVTLPRGTMRRPERATYLTIGALLGPVAALFGASYSVAPIVLALALVALVGNVSAVRRIASLMALSRFASEAASEPAAPASRDDFTHRTATTEATR